MGPQTKEIKADFPVVICCRESCENELVLYLQKCHSRYALALLRFIDLTVWLQDFAWP